MSGKIDKIDYVGSNEQLFDRLFLSGAVTKNAEIIVPETHVAIIIKDGKAHETLDAGRYYLKDKISLVSKLFGGAKDVISLQVIYISKTCKMRLRWGTPQQIDLRDPMADIPVKVGANGEVIIQIGEPRQFFLQMVGADESFTIDNLQERILSELMSEFKPALAKTMREMKLSYYMVDEFMPDIVEQIKNIIGKLLLDSYGIKMCSFFINRIIIPDNIKAEIEKFYLENKKEIKEERDRIKKKLALKEELAELERLADKQWEREKYMLELKTRDYDRYLEVCKIIGWKVDKAPSANTENKAGGYCSKCGQGYSGNAVFCNKCGNKVGATEKICACGATNSSDACFCSGCGKKI